MNPATLNTIAQIAQAQAEANAFSGVIRLQQDNDILWQGAFGEANRAWHIPNTLKTRFRTASISKMLTAVAILQLVDEGLLALETHVLDCLPLSSTTIPPQTTIFHLLTMSAGIADWLDETEDWEAKWAELRRTTPLYLLRQNRDYLPLFSQKPPLGPMGIHQYSNSSYILLGLVLEQQTGLSYPELIRQRVLAPAGMGDTGFWGLDEVVEGVAEGYIPERAEDGTVQRWLRNVYEATPDAAADGGIISTSADLCRFLHALRQGQLLSPALTQAMLTPQIEEDTGHFHGYDWAYGFGNNFILQNGQVIRYGHTGEEVGVSGRLYHYPGLNLDVVILGNQSTCAGSLSWAIHDAILAPDSLGLTGLLEPVS